MGIGKIVRRALGPLEPVVSDAYRRFFFDLPSFAAEVSQLAAPKQVVEVGCGEGVLLAALTPYWVGAKMVGIDLFPEVGRLFQGDRARVHFFQSTAADFAAAHAHFADVVLVCDVMHHVPLPEREAVLQSALHILKPGGLLVFKEWVKQPSLIYALGYFSDRYITGDRIQYETLTDWRLFLARPGVALVREIPGRPWKSNHAFILEKQQELLP